MGTLAASRKSIENFIKSEKSVEITDQGGKVICKIHRSENFYETKTSKRSREVLPSKVLLPEIFPESGITVVYI